MESPRRLKLEGMGSGEPCGRSPLLWRQPLVTRLRLQLEMLTFLSTLLPPSQSLGLRMA